MRLNMFNDIQRFILIIFLFLSCSNNNLSNGNTNKCQSLSSDEINDIVKKLEKCIYNKSITYNIDDLLMQYSQNQCFFITDATDECDSSLIGNKFLIFDAFEQDSCISYVAPVTHYDFLFTEDKFTESEGAICMTSIINGTSIFMIEKGYRKGCKFFLNNIIEYCQDNSINFIKFSPPLVGFISKDKNLNYIVHRSEKFCYKQFPSGSTTEEIDNFDCEPIAQSESYKGCYFYLKSEQSECYSCVPNVELCAVR